MVDRMKIILCFAVLLVVVYGQDDRIDACPTLTIMDPFQISNFTGTWYKLYGMNTPWEMGSCLQSTYTRDTDTGLVTINSSHRTIFGGKDRSSGTVVLANSSSSEGKLILTTTHYYLGSISGEMWILDTDYDNFAIAYSCKDMFSIPIESAWVFSRQQTLTPDSAQLIATAVARIAEEGGPTLSDMKPVSHKRCT